MLPRAEVALLRVVDPLRLISCRLHAALDVGPYGVVEGDEGPCAIGARIAPSVIMNLVGADNIAVRLFGITRIAMHAEARKIKDFISVP